MSDPQQHQQHPDWGSVQTGGSSSQMVMGGAAGDGAVYQQTISNNNTQVVPSQVVAPSYRPQQPQGSITRFATPDMQQRQQQQYGTTASPSAGGGGGYAARSQQLYQSNPQQPSALTNTNVYGNTASGGQQHGYNTSNVSTPTATYGQSTTTPQMNYGGQQPQPQPAPSPYGSNYGQPQMQQQQHTTTPYGQQPQFQQQQQQSAYANASHATQSLYGQQQPQVPQNPAAPPPMGLESTQQQQKYLTDSLRNLQEQTYYLKQGLENNNISVVLDRSAQLFSELGGPPHGQQHANNTHCSYLLTPKNYYELYMRALDDIPTLQEFLLQLTQSIESNNNNNTIRIVEHRSEIATTTPYTMKQLYEYIQYCPRVMSRLYLQIIVGTLLIQTKNCGANWVLQELHTAVRCEQNPIRGLFLRHFLLTALKDYLPDTPPPPSQESHLENEQQGNDEPDDDDSAGDAVMQEHKVVPEDDPGTVVDAYEFVLSNFTEMNKLWVRIQHLPGEGKNVRKRRERERNDLRVLVGTNLVRLSQLESVTSKLYGEVILPHILDHIVVAGDPLSQAYVMDCLVQVFPDEYHIETLPVLLQACPKLRDKVNIRTILQGLMDRLANYLAEEELLDETDTNQVKKTLANDSFGLFEECVQNVYNARGPKLTSKEVIRLQTALLQFSIRCYPENMDQVRRAIDHCVEALRQANASYDATGTIAENVPPQALDDASVAELEKLLTIPLDTLALRVLELEQYSVLIGFLPYANRRAVAIRMLTAVEKVGTTPQTTEEIDQLFSVCEPLLGDHPENKIHVGKLIHLLDHQNLDTLFKMLGLARTHINQGGALVSVVYASLRLAQRLLGGTASNASEPVEATGEGDESEVANNENGEDAANPEMAAAVEMTEPLPIVENGKPTTTCRAVLVFVQETLTTIASLDAEKGLKLYLDVSLVADKFAKLGVDDASDFSQVAHELLTQAFTLYEERVEDGKSQFRCVNSLASALLASKSLSSVEYEALVTKTAQFAARILKKPEQCQLVSLCAHLFYPVDMGGDMEYRNAQRSLECLQRSLRLADACYKSNPAYVGLFVDLLEDYVFFFEKGSPVVTHSYITGLIALVRQHLNSAAALGSVRETKTHFSALLRHLKERKENAEYKELYEPIQLGD